jgi:hypothetical protein
MLTRDEMISILQKNNCTVTFTKVNNEVRTMPCTLQESVIPLVENKGTKKPNETLVSVWCLDKKEWRSFRVNSVTQFTIN